MPVPLQHNEIDESVDEDVDVDEDVTAEESLDDDDNDDVSWNVQLVKEEGLCDSGSGRGNAHSPYRLGGGSTSTLFAFISCWICIWIAIAILILLLVVDTFEGEENVTIATTTVPTVATTTTSNTPTPDISSVPPSTLSSPTSSVSSEEEDNEDAISFDLLWDSTIQIAHEVPDNLFENTDTTSPLQPTGHLTLQPYDASVAILSFDISSLKDAFPITTTANDDSSPRDVILQLHHEQDIYDPNSESLMAVTIYQLFGQTLHNTSDVPKEKIPAIVEWISSSLSQSCGMAPGGGYNFYCGKKPDYCWSIDVVVHGDDTTVNVNITPLLNAYHRVTNFVNELLTSAVGGGPPSLAGFNHVLYNSFRYMVEDPMHPTWHANLNLLLVPIRIKAPTTVSFYSQEYFNGQLAPQLRFLINADKPVNHCGFGGPIPLPPTMKPTTLPPIPSSSPYQLLSEIHNGSSTNNNDSNNGPMIPPVDANCTAAMELFMKSILLDDACQPTVQEEEAHSSNNINGSSSSYMVCPTACLDLFQELNRTCSAKSYITMDHDETSIGISNTTVEQFDFFTTVMDMKALLLADVCADQIVVPGPNLALGTNGNCTKAIIEASQLFLYGTECKSIVDDGDVSSTRTGELVCPTTCQKLMDDLLVVCYGKHYYDKNGTSRLYNHAATVLGFQTRVADEVCSNAITFGIDTVFTCERQFEQGYIFDQCEIVDNIFNDDDDVLTNHPCPLTCTKAVTELQDTCYGKLWHSNKATGSAMPYSLTNILAGWQDYMYDSCKEYVINMLVETTELTCTDSIYKMFFDGSFSSEGDGSCGTATTTSLSSCPTDCVTNFDEMNANCIGQYFHDDIGFNLVVEDGSAITAHTILPPRTIFPYDPDIVIAGFQCLVDPVCAAELSQFRTDGGISNSTFCSHLQLSRQF